MHVKHFDHTTGEKFIDLGGNFTKNADRGMDINPEIYHLMNTSAQRVSIKSLDMQRQSQHKTTSNSPSRIVKQDHNFGMKKQSFPEVVGFLSNPFQKNNLNFAARNQ
jgi:hypothetical protein